MFTYIKSNSIGSAECGSYSIKRLPSAYLQLVMARSVIIRSSVGFGPFKIGVDRSVSSLRPETESSIPITSDGPICYYPVFGRSVSGPGP